MFIKQKYNDNQFVILFNEFNLWELRKLEACKYSVIQDTV